MPENTDLTIVIIDYSAGNLRSVSNAIKKLGYRPHISSDPKNMDRACLPVCHLISFDISVALPLAQTPR